MEAAIVSGIIKEVITSLGTAAFNEIAKLVCVKREIRNLLITFKDINAKIRDADRIVAHSEVTDNLLKHLREYAYEAENIIDLFSIELGPPQEPRPQGWRCCREVGIRCKAASDIQELNKKLESITPALLQVVPLIKDQTGENIYVGPKYDESNGVGRNIANECSNLVGILRDQGDRYLSFAIVGAAGVGKTTLARKIYHDTSHTFTTRLWVHVSDDSRELSIWLGDDTNSLVIGETRAQREVLRGHVRNARNSRVLLVIDNVWGENDWNQFLEQDFCRRGNTLLVTTRYEDAVRIMAIARCHRIGQLSEEDGWMLLHKMAKLRQADAAGGFEDVGRRIVQKCSGLPVAIRRIGYDLRGRGQGDWEEVYASDFFDRYSEIHNSIDTSYKTLSYQLKRCFLYCLLYPEGSVLQKQCITQHWIAEGFFSVTASQEEEAQSERCYQELIDRCLLLPEDTAPGEPGAKMPKLFRLFAIHRSQHENYVSNPRDITTIFKPWRLCVTNGYSVQDIPDVATSLRSLFLFGSPLNNGSALELIFNKLTSPRVLDLRDTQVETISSNLERLRQLRYLNLSGTRIRSLPASVGNLTVLQFLILQNCTLLKSLPRHVCHLKNLRTLDISRTPLLNDVQFKLLQLTQLKCLQGFIPTISTSENNGDGWKFEELRTLVNLRSLRMVKLERALSSGDDVKQLNLHEKPHLKELELWCSSAYPQSRDRNAEKDVFKELRPAECLVSLKIVNYCGNQFPSWLSSSYLTALQRLTLDGCLPSLDLPTLGQMENLKFLVITASNIIPEGNINQLPRERRNHAAFPLLEQLVLGRMESLEPWSGLQEIDLPMLGVFHLGGCRRGLISIPSRLQSCRELTSMKIQNADTLQEIANLPSLKDLEVHNCSRLRRISNIRRLEGPENLRLLRS